MKLCKAVEQQTESFTPGTVMSERERERASERGGQAVQPNGNHAVAGNDIARCFQIRV